MSYGIPMYDALRGDRRPEDALRSYLREFEPDWLSLPMFLPARALELAQPVNMHWATEDAPNIPFQYTDQCFLETDEDWDDFLRDPTLFLLTRVLPAKYKSLAGLRLLDPYKLCAPVPAGLGSIAAPPLREALLKLIEIADIFEESGKSAARYLQIADEEGVPCKAGHMLSPFDEFGDSLRGFLETSMDMITEPERFAAAVEKWEAVSVPAAMSMAKAMGAKMIHIPLHCGLDEFMSPANYEKYYWPPLKRMIETIIAAGMTPLVITEGNYNSRLEQLCDVPKGKVIYSFEKVDMRSCTNRLKPFQ